MSVPATDAPPRRFTREDETTASCAKALGHPARLAILRTLAQRNTCMCGELVDALPLAQSTVSQHLRVLRESGFITGEISGPRSCYCIDADRVRQIREDLDRFFRDLEGATSCGC